MCLLQLPVFACAGPALLVRGASGHTPIQLASGEEVSQHLWKGPLLVSAEVAVVHLVVAKPSCSGRQKPVALIQCGLGGRFEALALAVLFRGYDHPRQPQIRAAAAQGSLPFEGARISFLGDSSPGE